VCDGRKTARSHTTRVEIIFGVTATAARLRPDREDLAAVDSDAPSSMMPRLPSASPRCGPPFWAGTVHIWLAL
jgi:hypothetical protein